MTSNSIQFYSGSAGIEVLRLSKDGIWANPEIPADEAAQIVLNVIDYNIKVLVQKAVEEERDACAKVCEEKQQYAMPIPCPDGIDGCSVMHSVPARREKTGQECAEAIRARGEK